MEFSTVQEVNKHCRDMLLRVATVDIAVSLWRDLAFQDKMLVLGGIPDQRSAEFFQEAVEASGVEKELPFFLTDYMVFGRFAAHLLFDVRLGWWCGCVPLDLDYCCVGFVPSSGEPIVSIEITPEQQEWASSTDPRVTEQRANLDPAMVASMARGEPINLQSENTLFLARRAFSSDFYGTSWLSNLWSSTLDNAYNMKPAEVLFKLQVHLSKIHDDRDFQTHYVDAAARLRDHICNYVFRQKMFPFLAKGRGYKLTPTIEWIDKEGAEPPRSIVIRALEKTGSLLTTLEAQQEFYICGEESKDD